MAAPPSVYEFIDYLAYLQAWFTYKNAQRKGRFGMRAFARFAGMSPGAVSMILSGDRVPTEPTIDKLVKAMDLDRDEAKFFTTLIALATAPTQRARSRILERVYRNPRFKQARALDSALLALYSNWYIMAVRELSLLDDFEPEAAWIADRLVPRITVEQAQYALDSLIEAGLLRVEDDGSLSPREPRLQTKPDVDRHLGISYHDAMLRLARDALDEVPPDRRSFVAVSVPVPRQMVAHFRDEADAFVRGLMNQADAEDGPRDDIVQINVQMFSITADD